eukprot:CAMPEP_0201664748 /NCGR_PEP_ID=MMETSP0494-20130426/6112_1 /ASSEMBLY_ACC=CAM_ASM_000839 /TAXON_ID=420259 /ORGANISM="Thalassiosira gravida, Strain GMp14c1" /LENGTH=232 /DNA_ID=CAMNT_0048143575 /DNA_START=145 /DNA_END=839 /DNA_ORIENTATION=+
MIPLRKRSFVAFHPSNLLQPQIGSINSSSSIGQYFQLGYDNSNNSFAGTEKFTRSVSSRSRRRAKKKNLANGESSGSVETQQSSSAQKSKKGNGRRKRSKRPEESLPAFGPTGRPIMAETRFNNEDLATALNVSDNGDKNHPKNILSIAKEKMQFTQHVHHSIVGTNVQGNAMLMATTTTTFGEGVLSNDKKGPVELVCCGLGTSKKRAEFYAAVDLIVALRERNIDAKNPP